MRKIQQLILYLTFLPSQFIEAVFPAFIGTLKQSFVDTLSAASITSSHVITEQSILLPPYKPFSQLHVKGFYSHSIPILNPFYNIFHMLDYLQDFYSHTNINHYSNFDSSYICYRQSYTYIHMQYVLFICSTHLFLLAY